MSAPTFAERYRHARLYAAQVRARRAMGDNYAHARPWQGPTGVMKRKDRRIEHA